MSYLVARPSTARRRSLLGTVIAAHALVGIALLAIKSVAPEVLERPLIVDLLQPVEVARREPPKPIPVAKPQAAATTTPQQPVEATTSNAPAVSAPAAVVAPAPTTPASESMTRARFDADYLHNPSPTYPALSRRRGEEGKVVLRVSVTPQGTADSVEVGTSSGSSRLDEAALNTVKNWKFIPAKRGDVSIQSWVLVPIIFRLEF